MSKPYNSIKVFQNPWLERLTHVQPIVPLLVWLPVAAWFLWKSIVVHELSAGAILGTGALGFVSWTLFEYLLHRFIFHYEGEGPFGHRMHFLLHGLHHADPNDPTRLVMPPVASIFLGIAIYQGLVLVVGPVYSDPFFVFFLVGYLMYDYTHFYLHHAKPRTALGRYLKQGHMDHHYINQNSRWGVSSPFWDFVFGTYYEKTEKKEQTV